MMTWSTRQGSGHDAAAANALLTPHWIAVDDRAHFGCHLAVRHTPLTVAWTSHVARNRDRARQSQRAGIPADRDKLGLGHPGVGDRSTRSGVTRRARTWGQRSSNIAGMTASSESTPSRYMLGDQQIADADLEDWRKLGQGLHARFLPSSFTAAARFLAAVAEVAHAAGHAPQVRMDARFVDLKLISEDAIYRDEDGVEHQVEWVTQRDVVMARRIGDVARRYGLRSDPSSITAIELALDTAHAEAVAPVWSALLTGSADAQGRGTISEDIRDATG